MLIQMPDQLARDIIPPKKPLAVLHIKILQSFERRIPRGRGIRTAVGYFRIQRFEQAA